MRIGGNHRALRLFMLKNEARVRRSWNRHNKATADKLSKSDLDYALRYGDLFWPLVLIVTAAVFDFLDGFLDPGDHGGLSQRGIERLVRFTVERFQLLGGVV